MRVHLPSLPRPRIGRPRLDRGIGPVLGGSVRVALLGAIVVLAGLSAVTVFGFVSSNGIQPGQLQPKPSASLSLMPMGNAHIPTTSACVLCHSAGGEVKAPPAILHPVEGWRRCLACHTNETLGRTAPGHEGIAETECLNCHKTGQAGPAITQPHAVLHDQHCLDCHGSVAHLPATMASSRESDCVLCHKPATLPPPAYPHAQSASLSCRACHQSAEVGALPIDHALRADSTCLLCHEITVVATNGKPGTLGPGSTGLPGSSPGILPGSSAGSLPTPGFSFPIVIPTP